VRPPCPVQVSSYEQFGLSCMMRRFHRYEDRVEPMAGRQSTNLLSVIVGHEKVTCERGSDLKKLTRG